MKIAMISEHASPLAALGGADAGGQNVHVAQLAAGLVRLGHEVTVYTRRDDRRTRERVRMPSGVTVVHVPAGPPDPLPKDDLLPYVDDLAVGIERDWAEHGRPDVVHAHFWMSGLAALKAGRGSGVPVAQTFHALGTVKRRHQGPLDTSPPDRLRLEARVADEVDLVIATCADELAELEAMGVSSGHVCVVPCGVDTRHFTPGDGGSDRLPPRRGPRLLVVGRLVERKGVDLAVRALAAVPGADLVVVGGPPAEELDGDPEARRLRAVADEEGVADRVHLVGQVPHEEMPEVYRSVDVVLAVPWYEPFGITPLEAGACGRAVVGSAVGGLLDSVEDGGTGLLVPPRDVEAVARAVRSLLEDPATAHRMGERARRRTVERFDWDVVARATEGLLRDLAGRNDQDDMAPAPAAPGSWLTAHAVELRGGLASLAAQEELVHGWGEHLATVLTGGGRLLAAGNGGSAAEAQHLTAELVGRWNRDRRPFSAISLSAETSSLTAILNDYGADEVFARQVEAHGRTGDVLVLLSTSGSSSNVLHAAERAHALGLRVWAMTGPAPNPLSVLADETLVVDAPSTAAVQEVQLVAVHAVCAALDDVLESRGLMAAGPTCRQGS